MLRTIAVMQPYFFPYAGYFRLLARADVFVLLDCVQQRKGGRVHRCEVPAPGGRAQWLTLPLQRSPLDTVIRDLRFAAGADAEWARRMARHRWISQGRGEAADPVRDFLQRPLGESVVDALDTGLRLVARLLRIDTEIVRSSALDIDASLRGQERVIAIVEQLRGRRYLNAPGGRALYVHADFAARGIELAFDPDYTGPHRHLLYTLMVDALAPLRAEVLA